MNKPEAMLKHFRLGQDLVPTMTLPAQTHRPNVYRLWAWAVTVIPPIVFRSLIGLWVRRRHQPNKVRVFITSSINQLSELQAFLSTTAQVWWVVELYSMCQACGLGFKSYTLFAIINYTMERVITHQSILEHTRGRFT